MFEIKKNYNDRLVLGVQTEIRGGKMEKPATQPVIMAK